MCTLFVVDDDITYQRIVKLILSKNSVFKHVLYFSQGDELMHYLKKYNNDGANLPDIIFLDLNMPELDGWAVLDTLQKLHRSYSKNISVYVVTVSVREVDKERAMEYSIVKEYISKPLYREKIMSIVNDFNNNTQFSINS